MQTINISLEFENNYAQHAAATIASVLENNISNRKYHFYIFSPSIEKNNKLKIEKLIYNYKQEYTITSDSFDYENFNKFIMDKYPHIDHYATAFFYKILFQKYLPKDITKILSLDSDTIVMEDISNLYDLDIKNYMLAAVKEDISKNHLKQISFTKDNLYFNSGVLLFDLKQWHEKNIQSKVDEMIEDKKLKYTAYDQDILNIIFKDNFYEVKEKYNQMIYLFNTPALFSKIKSKYKNIEGIGEKGIIHFTGMKPWEYESLHPYNNLYYKYLEKTPYKGFKPTVDKKRRISNIIESYYILRKIKRLFR